MIATTEAEEWLLRACKEGFVAEVAELPIRSRDVRSEFVRWLCERSVDRQLVSVRGIRLSGARILGDLDLEGAEVSVPLWLDECQIDKINVRAATTSDISLDGSSFSGLMAERVRVYGRLFMRGAKVTGEVDIDAAILDGEVGASGATFTNSSGIAIRAQGIRAAGWIMNKAHVKGLVDLNSATLERDFSFNGATFESPNRRAINAQGVVAVSWFMNNARVVGKLDLNASTLKRQFCANDATFDNGRDVAVSAQGAKVSRWIMRETTVGGQFNVNAAVLDGQFSANGTTFSNPNATAILAQAVRASDWTMNNANVHGKFDINSAVIDSQFSANGALFNNPGDVALRAQAATVSSWFMRDARVYGRMDFNAVTLVGQFSASGATFDNLGDVAIRANSTRTAGWMMSNVTVRGQLNLTGVVFTGQFNASDSTFDNPGEIAIQAQRIVALDWVMRNVTVNGGLRFDAGQLTLIDLTTARLVNATLERSLSCINTSIERLRLPNTPPKGDINLSRATIDTIEDHRGGWLAAYEPGEQHSQRSHLVLDGTTYDNLEFPDGDSHINGRRDEREYQWHTLRNHLGLIRDRDWFRVWWRNHRVDSGNEIWQRRVRWLMSQSPDDLYHRFNPQPWKQLERTLVKMGYEQDARHVAVQRHVVQRRADRNRPRRAFSWLLHQLADYGFNPWKTIFWSLGLIILCGWVFTMAASCNWYCPPEGTTVGDFYAVGAGDVFSDSPVQKSYPDFNSWLYSLDLFIPILNLGMEQFWRPNNGWIFLLTVTEQFLGAFLVALTASGFAGLLTRDERGQ